MKLPKISIVIPSYNKVKYIEETLRSIVDQKYPNLEVIIQDGGSSDGTLDIIKKYVKKYPKIFSFESKKDKGQTEAINKGFKKATGDIFGYINADDVYEKGALLIVGQYFVNNPKTLWLVGRGRIINENGEERGRLVTIFKNLILYLNKYTFLLMLNYMMQPSVFLARSVYVKNGPLIGLKKMVMEYDFWLKIGKSGMPQILNQYLSSFRLEKTGSALSVKYYKVILSEDTKIVTKYTKNFTVLIIHKLFNLGRMLLVK